MASEDTTRTGRRCGQTIERGALEFIGDPGVFPSDLRIGRHADHSFLERRGFAPHHELLE
jgi:hypothetical protein